MSKTVEIIDEDKFISDIVNLACAAHSIIDLDVSADHAETALIFLASGVVKTNIEEIVYEDAETAQASPTEKPQNILGYTVRHIQNNTLPTAQIFGNPTDVELYIEKDLHSPRESYQVVTITGEGPEAPSVKAVPAKSAGFVVWTTENDEIFEHRPLTYKSEERAQEEIDNIISYGSYDNEYLGYKVGNGELIVKEIFV